MGIESLLGRSVRVHLKENVSGNGDPFAKADPSKKPEPIVEETVVWEIQEGMAHLHRPDGSLIWRAPLESLEAGSDESAIYHLGEIVFNKT